LLLSTTAIFAEDPTVAELIAKVAKSPDEATKLAAIDSLGLLGKRAADAVPTLTATLKDPSAAVRAHAVQTLGEIGDAAKAAVPGIAALVGDSDATVRREAMEAIAAIHPGPKVTVPLFVKMLESADAMTRQAAMDTLANQGKAAVPFLIESLAAEKATYWACLVLNEIGPEAQEAVPALIKVMGDKRPEVRREAILALVQIGDAAAAIPSILKAVDDPDTATAAIFALGHFKKATPEAEAKIQKQLSSSDPVLAAVSIWTLARLHPEDKKLAAEAVDRLCEGLKSENSKARKAAAHALAGLKPDAELLEPALEKSLKGAKPETVEEALNALASMGPIAVPKLVESLKHERIRPLIIGLIGRQGAAAEPAVGALIGLLDDKSPDVRREAGIALARIGPAAKAAVPVLLERFAKADAPIQCGIAYVLGRIGSPEALPVLTKATEADDEAVAILSAWAMVQIKPKDAAVAAKALPLLIRGLRVPEEKLRRGAAEAIQLLGPLAKAALPELQKALKDEDESVRDAAEAAIKAIGD
jgi:HEAT repeat protein